MCNWFYETVASVDIIVLFWLEGRLKFRTEQ
jgi:hypothetical protein